MNLSKANVAVCTTLVAGALLVSGVAFAQTTTPDLPTEPNVNNTTYSTTTINATVPNVPNTGSIQQSDVSTTTMIIAVVAFIAAIGLLLFIATRRPETATTINRFEDRA